MNGTSSRIPVRVGFIPLVDCAVLVAAHEQGFAADNGLELHLLKEVSWANIRDRINVGMLDVAHMLAGMPIAQSLGINHVPMPTIAPIALSTGGNAITVSRTLHQALHDSGCDLSTPLGAAQALRHVIAHRSEHGMAPLSFGHVFPFSCHHYQLRYWMAAVGIAPDRDVRLAVIPPPYMVKSLESSQIDGFCVGEPWNRQAVAQNVGTILMPVHEFWPNGPEKVLGLHQRWADENPDTLAALLRALGEAARWCDDPSNRAELATLLARPEYLDVREEHIIDALDGTVAFTQNGAPIRPEPAQALWLYAQMVRWQQTPLSAEGEHAARRTFRPDLLAQAVPSCPPPAANAPAHTLDGLSFDPADLAGYIQALDSSNA